MYMRKNKAKFFIGLLVALGVITASIFGGYIMIDKLLVPKYFSQYGINNLPELVELVKTIYIVPNEDTFITNPYTDFDNSSAKNKLIKAGFPTLKNNELDYESIASSAYTLKPDETMVDNFIVLTDKEVAGLSHDILSSGILVSSFPDLSYINTLNMEIKQLSITPEEESLKENIFNEEDLIEGSALNQIVSTTPNATLLITIKIDTESARKQISENLSMPLFLIDWIIPDTMYVTSTIDTYINKETNKREYKNATLSINSKTAKQSEVLLKLLISFIFPDESFTIDEFSNQLASLAIEGINMLGNLNFAYLNTPKQTTTPGIVLHI